MNKRAIILLSGGVDSATCLAVASSQKYDCYALSFDYGQKHRSELVAARHVAQAFKVKEHNIFKLPIGELGGSALTDATMDVPDFVGDEKIPTTYVPARNTIFLSVALGWAEVVKANDIFIGVSAVDYSGYPDCRPEYIAAFEVLANLATKTGVESNPFKIHTPLLHLSKAETIRMGLALGVDYSLTVSCYRANTKGEACGTCDSCTLRKQGFTQAGIADPTVYVS